MRITPSRDLQIPDAAAEFSADYWDSFRVADVPGTRPGEWAARSLAGADAANRAFGVLVWHTLMGFELAPRGAQHSLVGWRVTTDSEDAFVMDVDGPRSAGRMQFLRIGDDLVWTTMLRHHGRTGGAVWSVLGHAHRALAPRNLAQARRSLARAA